MSTAKKDNSGVNDNEVPVTKPKTCFVIMPIADHPDYEAGHFDRVYEYLIKPACIRAGYDPRRADDNKASNMIMFDILKKIMECDMAICDLSSKNANVFYELGLRQAFNKKTILITDGRENAPFDIAAFRYVRYSASLRIDTVLSDTDAIIEMLDETENAPEDDVNSIVKLLKIQPAHVDKLQLSQQESVLFDMFKSVDNKLNILANSVNHINKKNNTLSVLRTRGTYNENKITFHDIMKHDSKNIHSYIYQNWDGVIGRYIGTNESGEMVFKNGDKQYNYPNVELSWENIFASS